MGETSYIIDLTPDGRNRYRHRHVSEKGKSCFSLCFPFSICRPARVFVGGGDREIIDG